MALCSGYQLTPEAFELLGRFGDPAAAIESLLSSFETASPKPIAIEAAHLRPLLDRQGAGPARAAAPAHTPNAAAFHAAATVPEPAETPAAGSYSWPSMRRDAARIPAPAAAQSPARPAHVRPTAVFGGDVTVISGSEDRRISGTIDDFKQYFLDRYGRMESILRRRADLRDATSVSNLPHGERWQKVKAIGMVTSKRDFKDGTCTVELEDTQDSVRVSFKADDALKKKVTRLLKDEVVCVSGATKTGRTILANDIIWPDVSYRQRPAHPQEPTYAVLTSDVHIGSKMFMEENFRSFLKWLNCEEGDERSTCLAEQVKYLLIAGDLVDGVGIYPNQEEELSITDLHTQYEKAAEYLAMVPERIRIIVIPGNHDACRPTLPTPPMYREYAQPVYDLKNVVMLGDPATVNIEGTTFLLTHGRSLDDSIPSLPGCDFKTPQNAMVELLKSRHLAPIFGEKTPLAPESSDRLIIDPVPDIFHAGHIHVEGIASYRGIVVVNSGTWQAQTKFQLSAGIVPKPCIAPITDLMSGKTIEMNFNFSGTAQAG
jgi:DNA polymerase II small subunit